MKVKFVDSLVAIATGVFVVLVLGYLLLAMIGTDPQSWLIVIAAIVICFLVALFNGHTNVIEPR